MKTASKSDMIHALRWCASIMGPVEVVSDRSKTHGGHESSTCRLRATNGSCYLKVHQTPSHWNQEVHAYERWACAFGNYAPRLLAVRDQPPLALIVSEVPGQVLEHVSLARSQEEAVWRAAGAALAALHKLTSGDCFGPCLRDGTCAEQPTGSATEYLSRRFSSQIRQGLESRCINPDELAILQAAMRLIPAFEGERPVPCHRDYNAANLLVSEAGTWTGVIDFEFAYWDVRVADLTRDPHWSWIHRPNLFNALREGYGAPCGPAHAQQILVGHALYALDAIVWGHDHAFYGFEREGRESLAHLASATNQYG